MEKKIGIWIDRHKAMIVDPENEHAPYVELHSELNGFEPDKPYRETHRNPEKKLQAKRDKILRDYYNNVVNSLDNESDVLIFGPAQAKHELQKTIDESPKRFKHITIETGEKMTDNQVVAKVKAYFKMRNQPRKV